MKKMVIVMLAALVTGCGLSTQQVADGAISALIIKSQADPVVAELTVFLANDETALSKIEPSYTYLRGRAEYYAQLDQALQVVPLIVQRQALWDKAKDEAYSIRDALTEYSQRSDRDIPPLTRVFIEEVEVFISVVDAAIETDSGDERVELITKNLTRIALILGGMPQFAGMIPG